MLALRSKSDKFFTQRKQRSLILTCSASVRRATDTISPQRVARFSSSDRIEAESPTSFTRDAIFPSAFTTAEVRWLFSAASDSTTCVQRSS